MLVNHFLYAKPCSRLSGDTGLNTEDLLQPIQNSPCGTGVDMGWEGEQEEEDTKQVIRQILGCKLH